MADLLVEWADLVDMPMGQLLGAGGGAGSGGSLSRAYSIGAGSSRTMLHSSTSVGATGAGADAMPGQDGAHLDVLLLQVGCNAAAGQQGDTACVPACVVVPVAVSALKLWCSGPSILYVQLGTSMVLHCCCKPQVHQ
jgi:hypothetical protein